MSDLKEPIELFGYECGEGWLPLIEEAKNIIDEWNEKHQEEEKLQFVQVKEKWGALCIYLNFYPDDMHKKMFDIEDRSRHICEECGKTEGTECKASHRWIYTLCPDCRKKEEERWNKLTNK